MNRYLKTFLALMLATLLSACDSLDKPTLSLYLAVQRGDIDQIHRHIAWGSDINLADSDGRRPLHVAAEQGEQVIIRLLLKNGADINALDGSSHSPLYTALMAGKTQVAEFLIAQGAVYDANQLLLGAIDNQVLDRDVFRLLTTLGADLNQLDSAGNTPLIRAINASDRVLVKYMIGQGANPNTTNAIGKFPLALAIEKNNTDIIRLLKRHGARTE